MEMNENFVEQTENVEQTTEETPKLFTQEEVNEIVGKSKARTRAKVEKEYQRKYGELTDVLQAGTGKKDVGEITDTFRNFYQSKGIVMKQKPSYTDKDIEVLVKAEAEEIIRGGFEEVIEEADRLKDMGVENMTARDKALFVALTDHIKDTETSRELSRIGVTEDVYKSKDFQEFKSMFRSDVPISKIYENYRNSQPKKEFKTMGSMKNSPAADNGVKDFYTVEEARRFKKEDFDKNPALFEAVQNSMQKWR